MMDPTSTKFVPRVESNAFNATAVPPQLNDLVLEVKAVTPQDVEDINGLNLESELIDSIFLAMEDFDDPMLIPVVKVKEILLHAMCGWLIHQESPDDHSVTFDEANEFVEFLQAHVDEIGNLHESTPVLFLYEKVIEHFEAFEKDCNERKEQLDFIWELNNAEN